MHVNPGEECLESGIHSVNVTFNMINMILWACTTLVNVAQYESD